MTCSEKRRFISKEDAKRYARRVHSHGNRKNRPYRCPTCRMWHLTTVNAADRAFHRRGYLGS